jgi:hypothetical protein
MAAQRPLVTTRTLPVGRHRELIVMHEARTPVGRRLLAATGLLAVPVLYVPFRLIAQNYNIATTASFDAAGNVHHLDNFAYPFSILIWPAFAGLCGFLPPYVARRLGASWLFAVWVVWGHMGSLGSHLTIQQRSASC